MANIRIKLLRLAGLFLISGATVAGQPTRFELTQGAETANLDETYDYFSRLARASMQARWLSFGTTPEGRAMNMLIVSADGCFTPEQAHRRRKPIILVQGCIHAGETEGSDVCQMLARDLVVRNAYPDLMEHLILIFIPVFNVDGFFRFSPYHRINQNGPREMGWRATSTRHNLNRDFIKADTPEMRQWLKMFHSWQPHLFFDCHTTDGQDFQYVLTYNIDTHPEYGGAVSQWAKDDLLPPLRRALGRRGLITGPYAGLIDEKKPEQGMLGGVWRPMLSNSFATLCNRAGFLIEAHSLKPYNQRVHATMDLILESLHQLCAAPDGLVQAVQNEDAKAGRWAGSATAAIPLQFKTCMDRYDTLTYYGYKTEYVRGVISGQTYPVYTQQPQNTASKYYNDVETVVSVQPPLGYIVPAQWTAVLDVLAAHQIPLLRLPRPISQTFEMYRLQDVRFRTSSYEGRQTVTCSAQSVRVNSTFDAGDVYVSLKTPKAKLIMYLLEPQSPDALLAWGFFNTIFEDKEYFEEYVMEPMAQQMLKIDTTLAKRYCQKLAQDSLFAASGRERLRFFYEKSPYFDEEKNLYPVARVVNAIE